MCRVPKIGFRTGSVLGTIFEKHEERPALLLFLCM